MKQIKRKRIWLVLLVIFLLLLLYLLVPIRKEKLTFAQCILLGGQEINTLDYYDEEANDIIFPTQGPCGNKGYIGEITGLMCPCVCCKRL